MELHVLFQTFWPYMSDRSFKKKPSYLVNDFNAQYTGVFQCPFLHLGKRVVVPSWVVPLLRFQK